MASGYIGEHYVSTYILQRLYYSTSAVGSSGHNIYVENQLRRTNSYGGATYTYPSNSYISINGDRYNWNWTSGNYPSIPAYNTNWLTFCSRTVYVAHSSAVNVYVAGGNYNMGSYLSGDCGGNVYLDALYTAPAVPSADNLASDGTPYRAYSKVTNNGWGTNSSRRNFEIINAGRIMASDYNNSPASMYWTLDAASTNQNSCYVHTWYGRAVNNHVLWTDSGARYIATPSAPILTITPGTGTSPQTAISGTVTYKGGTQNSSTCNNGTMKRWQFGKQLSSESGVPGVFQNDTTTSDTTRSYSWSKDNFATGSNYKFYVRTVNTLGGTSYTVSQVIYCPSGVSGSMTARTTESLTLKGAYNYAGAINSSTSGTISCYEIKWSTDQAVVDAGGGTSTGLQTSNTFTITGLSNDQTIYYRVYAWNVYGLSNVSSTLSATTLPRYVPSLSNISVTPLSPGGHVTFTIDRTGGLTPTELVVSSVEISRRPASSSTFTTLKTVTELSLHTNDSYTIQNAWTDVATTEGDYIYKLHLSNGTDVADVMFTLQAPTKVTATAHLEGNEPIQISAEGSAVSTTQLYKWDLISVNTGQIKTINTSSLTPTITTSNHLDYDTAYALQMRAYNSYGLWRNSATVTQRTAPRFQFYSVSKGVTKKADGIFKHGNVESDVTEVYYIVKNSLGSVQVGEDLLNKRLTFITQSLRYRPENVASMLLSDGTKIAYGYDSANDVYKFGIWQGDNIITTFHDGWNWQMTEYEFLESIVVTAVSSTSGNLNASAAFSTTSCTEIPLWERENITGCGRVFYYTDNTYTKTSFVDIPNQTSVNTLAASDSGNNKSKNIYNKDSNWFGGYYERSGTDAMKIKYWGNGHQNTMCWAQCESGKTYTISANVGSLDVYNLQQILYAYSDVQPAVGVTLDPDFGAINRGDGSDIRATFTAPFDGYIALRVQCRKSQGDTTDERMIAMFNQINDTLQIEESSSKTSYEPYYGGTPTSSWSTTINGTTITNENVKSVVLTSSTTAIPNYFLANSPRLQSVVMNNANATSIGDYVCYNCDSLLTASLPSALTSVSSFVFYGCENFNKALTIPANVVSIGSYFLAFCVRQNQTVTLPSGLKAIYDYFMSGCGIYDQPFTIPDSVEYIGNYFMSANLLFDRNIALPSSLTHLGVGFMYNCLNMTKTLDVGEVSATVAQSSNETLSTLIDTAACYVTGISIKGDETDSWLTKFPERTTSPYRYAKEYVEPVIVDRDWDEGTTLSSHTITVNLGDFYGLPWSDIWTLQPISDTLLASTSYYDMMGIYPECETLEDVYTSLPFSKTGGYCYIDEGGEFNRWGSGLDAFEIVKEPTIALQWTQRGSSTVSTGINNYWQGRYIMSEGVYEPMVDTTRKPVQSYATITITSDDLKNLSNPSSYYLATLAYWNGTYGIYVSQLQESTYNSTTGAATFITGISGGPILLLRKNLGE